ncbi:MAG TPA: plasmid stabilization protein [Verrucomicrobiae bacterium]|nr:plasmid stabilization protein [Verrucomicrobiae bacterium]
MASITIRRLEETTKERLRRRAAQHGRSMEEEAREILKNAVNSASQVGNSLGEDIHRLFAPLGGVDIELPARVPPWEPPDFSGPEYDR